MSGKIKSNIRILFMGTPDFAASAFISLVDAGANVIGAVTQPDKPKGRGYVMTPPPVKIAAQERKITVFQPNTLKGEDFAELLISLNPDMIIVAAYGKLLPQNVLDFPKYGCINIHASLLPRWRGAAPIQRSIIAGDEYTGITTMKMDIGLDTGDIIEQEKCRIEENDNFETIHDKLAEIGAKLIISTVNGLVDGSLKAKKQSDDGMIYAAKIEKADSEIDFSCSAVELHNRIRGLSPFPLAVTSLGGRNIKLVSSRIMSGKTDKAPGTVLSLDGGIISVACGDGIIGITKVLPDGKKRMDSAAFINGRAVNVGDIFG